ncbi:MAG: hypothetical protein J0G32_02205 [Alphaproteobacteria bacterium]|nr:hypothetical protein [Alphaproteobacteria bacterium]
MNEGSPSITDLINENQVVLVLNTTHGKQTIADSFSIRRSALMRKVPYAITISGAKAIVEAMKYLKKVSSNLDVKSIQQYTSGR